MWNIWKNDFLACKTTLDLRHLAYQLAVRNIKKHNFNNEKETAGVDCMNRFLKSNSDLPNQEATSAARTMGFNPTMGISISFSGKHMTYYI